MWRVDEMYCFKIDQNTHKNYVKKQCLRWIKRTKRTKRSEGSFRFRCVTVDSDCPGILNHGPAVRSLDGDWNLSCLWETSQEAVLQSQRRLQEKVTTGWLLVRSTTECVWNIWGHKTRHSDEPTENYHQTLRSPSALHLLACCLGFPAA